MKRRRTSRPAWAVLCTRCGSRMRPCGHRRCGDADVRSARRLRVCCVRAAAALRDWRNASSDANLKDYLLAIVRQMSDWAKEFRLVSEAIPVRIAYAAHLRVSEGQSSRDMRPSQRPFRSKRHGFGINLQVGRELADALTTGLHELCHLATWSEWTHSAHGPRWRAELLRVSSSLAGRRVKVGAVKAGADHQAAHEAARGAVRLWLRRQRRVAAKKTRP